MTHDMTDVTFSEIIERIKSLKGLKTDTAAAEALGMQRSALAERKRRNSIPREELWNFARREGLRLDWLLTGEGPMYEDRSSMSLNLSAVYAPGDPRAGGPPQEIAPPPDDLERLLDAVKNEWNVMRDALARLPEIEARLAALEKQHGSTPKDGK